MKDNMDSRVILVEMKIMAVIGLNCFSHTVERNVQGYIQNSARHYIYLFFYFCVGMFVDVSEENDRYCFEKTACGVSPNFPATNKINQLHQINQIKVIQDKINNNNHIPLAYINHTRYRSRVVHDTEYTRLQTRRDTGIENIYKYIPYILILLLRAYIEVMVHTAVDGLQSIIIYRTIPNYLLSKIIALRARNRLLGISEKDREMPYPAYSNQDFIVRGGWRVEMGTDIYEGEQALYNNYNNYNNYKNRKIEEDAPFKYKKIINSIEDTNIYSKNGLQALYKKYNLNEISGNKKNYKKFKIYIRYKNK